jgi:hypothetical protein
LDINVKDIIIKPINSTIANAFVKKHHYSGKVVPNSQLHFGAFYGGVLHGVMSFGPSMRKDLIIKKVSKTGWNDFLELNRMAFDDYLPKNSESRSISVVIKLIKKQYNNIEWVVSFADGTQCGDGTIYRASGFVLVGIKENGQLRIDPKTNKPVQSMSAFHAGKSTEFRKWKKLEGFQLCYIYFLNKEARNRLTVPILPFSAIDKMGAGMYLGKKKTSGGSVTVAQPAILQERGGSIPTSPHNTGVKNAPR